MKERNTTGTAIAKRYNKEATADARRVCLRNWINITNTGPSAASYRYMMEQKMHRSAMQVHANTLRDAGAPPTSVSHTKNCRVSDSAYVKHAHYQLDRGSQGDTANRINSSGTEEHTRMPEGIWTSSQSQSGGQARWTSHTWR